MLVPEPAQVRGTRLLLFRELTAHGWERQTPAFAVRSHEAVRSWRDHRIPEHVRYGTVCRAHTLTGERALTLRSVGLDFTLVTGPRLQRDGLDQRLLSLGYALDGDEVKPDVLLAESWTRARSTDVDGFLEVVDRFFTDVEWQLSAPDRTLRHFRACARGLRVAA
ncbi:hypothetical protein ACWCPI_01620 [Streptomyces sp. NPDC001920]